MQKTNLTFHLEAELLGSNCFEEQVLVDCQLEHLAWDQGMQSLPSSPVATACLPPPNMFSAGKLGVRWFIKGVAISKSKADEKKSLCKWFPDRMMLLEFLCPCHSLRESLWHKGCVCMYVHMCVYLPVCVCVHMCIYLPVSVCARKHA